MIYALVGLAAALLFAALLVRWGTRWGSTPEERAQTMPGDELLEGGPRARVAMTRAVSLTAPPERVWPWIAQLGRGAGWYSVDRLDNGGRRSAWHIVSWIPEPRLGDATAVGYVRHLEPGRSIAWWSDGVRFLGANARLVVCYEVRAEGEGARLVSRMSADATGVTSRPMLHVFRAMDSIMACSQLIGLRERIESWERDDPRREEPETGARDQYQVYDVLYADGGRAGVEGKETGAKWRAAAIRDGVLDEPS